MEHSVVLENYTQIQNYTPKQIREVGGGQATERRKP